MIFFRWIAFEISLRRSITYSCSINIHSRPRIV